MKLKKIVAMICMSLALVAVGGVGLTACGTSSDAKDMRGGPRMGGTASGDAAEDGFKGEKPEGEPPSGEKPDGEPPERPDGDSDGQGQPPSGEKPDGEPPAKPDGDGDANQSQASDSGTSSDSTDGNKN